MKFWFNIEVGYIFPKKTDKGHFTKLNYFIDCCILKFVNFQETHFSSQNHKLTNKKNKNIDIDARVMVKRFGSELPGEYIRKEGWKETCGDVLSMHLICMAQLSHSIEDNFKSFILVISSKKSSRQETWGSK